LKVSGLPMMGYSASIASSTPGWENAGFDRQRLHRWFKIHSSIPMANAIAYWRGA
jgi:hypothetical protein